MSALKENIQQVEEAAEAVIEAKQALCHQFQQDILKAMGDTEKAKREKILLQQGDSDRKIVANLDRHLHNLISKSQLEGVVEDDKPVRSTKYPKRLVVFK